MSASVRWTRYGFRRLGLQRLIDWVLNHTTRRYHIINLKGEAKYKHGWIDADDKMLLACFKILRDFVEREDPTVGLEPISSHRNLDEERLEARREIRRLYVWWTEEREREMEARRRDLLSDNPQAVSGGLDRDDEMLARLIRVRCYMWT